MNCSFGGHKRSIKESTLLTGDSRHRVDRDVGPAIDNTFGHFVEFCSDHVNLEP